MPQLARNWYFEERQANSPASRKGGGTDHDDDSAPGLTSVPAALLLRHGARVLDPSDAPAIPAGRGRAPRTPRPTVYRARTLLIPGDLLVHGPFIAAVNKALEPVRMRVLPPDVDTPHVRCSGRAAEVLRGLPRVAALVPTLESGKPVVVDAWTALQTLRAAADDAEAEAKAKAEAKGGIGPLGRKAVNRIALEHLLFGSAISPSTEGNGLTGSPSTEGNGVTGPGSTNSYVYRGGDTRAPVAVCLDKPARGRLADRASRRPVVAVLDTGVRAHSWLDVVSDPAHKYATVKPDGFVMVDPDMQDAIRAGGEDATARGDHPRPHLNGPWDVPVSDEPLLGELNDATGHGTFIAGIVRQVAPDARVLAIRIMHSDNVVNEGDLLCALHLLADRIAVAEAGDMAAMVDVVSLSLGYFDESSADVAYSSGLWQAISLLLELGVAVVAAAGNYATSRRFYPAAFTLEPPPGPAPLISVGALNPNGSKALFSNGGPWVSAWAAGAAVVSTFPDDINASRLPDVRVRAHPANQPPAGLPANREALDPDDYHGGFATWSGTSFSAPLLAAHIAANLEDRAADPKLGLDVPGAEAAGARIDAALTALKQIQARG